MKVAVVGGTGSFGKALALRLREGGYDVVVGSRDAERAAEAAAELGVYGATNADACREADLVVLATNADGTLDTARELADAIGATPVLSVAAELTFGPSGVVPTPEGSSIAAPHPGGRRGAGDRGAALARRAQPRRRGGARGGRPRLRRRRGGEGLVLELAERITSGRAIDCGPLASARALEGLTAVIVNVNKRYKAHAGMRVTGI